MTAEVVEVNAFEDDDDDVAAASAGVEGLRMPTQQQQQQQQTTTTTTTVSRHTAELAAATKATIDTFYKNLFAYLADRRDRRARTLAQMDALGVPDDARGPFWAQLRALETSYLRTRRQRLTGRAFESVRVIGRGAFGEVRLVRLRGTAHVYAMKKLSKAKMVERHQQLHVRAEREALAASNEVYHDNPWVVKLHYSFQDASFLYLLMEFVPGGDLMSQLIKRTTFTEEEAKFFTAETVIAIESIHRLRYAHRDIKPDNLLLDKEGHIKISDFGLCSLLGVDEQAYVPGAHHQSDTATSAGAAASAARQRRTALFSNVGTPDYTAPEVLQSLGYGLEVDWWSVGIILFEMLVGYPPFCSETASETCDKIVHFETTLPQVMRDSCKHLSREAKDLIVQLLAHQRTRIGARGGMAEILAHPFFRGLDWRNIRSLRSPIVPHITSPTDTSHFDEFDELEGAVGGMVAETWSPHRRKIKSYDIPFIGYTYRSFDSAISMFTRSPEDDDEDDASTAAASSAAASGRSRF